MSIEQYFLSGDIKGAIAFMRRRDEYKDVLPAYVAIFENCEYRTYDVPEIINSILRLYQIYFRDIFYCGLPRDDAERKLSDALCTLLDAPLSDYTALKKSFARFLKRTACTRFSEKLKAFSALMFGAKPSRRFTRWSCPSARPITRLTF